MNLAQKVEYSYSKTFTRGKERSCSGLLKLVKTPTPEIITHGEKQSISIDPNYLRDAETPIRESDKWIRAVEEKKNKSSIETTTDEHNIFKNSVDDEIWSGAIANAKRNIENEEWSRVISEAHKREEDIEWGKVINEARKQPFTYESDKWILEVEKQKRLKKENEEWEKQIKLAHDRLAKHPDSESSKWIRDVEEIRLENEPTIVQKQPKSSRWERFKKFFRG